MNFYKGVRLTLGCYKAQAIFARSHKKPSYKTVFRFATGNAATPYRDWFFDALIIAKGDFYENYKQNRTLFPLDWRRTGFKGIHRWR
jgi:hypothetical protein